MNVNYLLQNISIKTNNIDDSNINNNMIPGYMHY